MAYKNRRRILHCVRVLGSAFILFLALSIRPVNAVQVQFDILIEIREITTRSVISGRARLVAPSIIKNFLNTGSPIHSLNENINVSPPQIYKVIVDPIYPYLTRYIPFSYNESQSNVTRAHVFHVVRDQTFRLNDVESALKYFSDQRYDSALAFFQAAFNSTSVSAAKVVKLTIKYNYGRALMNACTEIQYATCSTALKVLKEIQADPDAPKTLKIGKKDLERAIRNLRARSARKSWLSFVKKFNNNDFQSAAHEAEYISTLFSNDKEVLSTLRLTKNRLFNDAGVAYLKAALKLRDEGGDPGIIRGLLESAHEKLLGVKNPDKNTKNNLELVSKMLKK